MKKLSQIFLGWWFWITNQNNKLARMRLSVCSECDSRKWGICIECGCPLQAKARVLEETCPLNKWPGMRTIHFR